MTQPKNMKTIITSIMLLITIAIYGQVGIGTTNPQATLHIADTPTDTLTFGLRIDKVPDTLFDKVMVISPFGEVGKRTLATILNTPQQRFQHIATDCTMRFIDTNVQPFIMDNIDIGQIVQVTILPNSIANIEVVYDIPVGIATSYVRCSSYIGVTFHKDGINLEEHDRKVSIDRKYPVIGQDLESYQAYNVEHSFFETVINSTNNTLTITYEVRGRIEQASQGSSNAVAYIFNRWCGPQNFGRGNGSITAIVEY